MSGALPIGYRLANPAEIATAKHLDPCLNCVQPKIAAGSGIADKTSINLCVGACAGGMDWFFVIDTDATPAKIAAAWARQDLVTLPALPSIEPGDAMDRVERTREDVSNLLTVLAAEMDAEGGEA
jgi:hypothetical protein